MSILNTYTVIDLIKRATFAPFTKNDWDAYSGCESKNPSIAYVDNWTIIADGDAFQFMGYDEYDEVTGKEFCYCLNIQEC